MHHAYVIEGGVEEGIARASAFIEEELGMRVQANPDVVLLRYGLLTAEEARKVAEIAIQGPIAGETKAIVIAASRAYHEAQNALLKLFEEPPPNTYLFLILPSLGGLLPTLRSRVVILNDKVRIKNKDEIPEVAKEFLKMSGEQRSTLIKKLATGSDEEERREHRDEAIAIMDGVERAAYDKFKRAPDAAVGITQLLVEISQLRGYLYERSAPVRMILEHLSLTLPRGLGSKDE